MNINKILICGSSYLTEKVVEFIKPHYNLVGYIPSSNHVFSTNIDLPMVDFSVDYDITLSIQFDKKIGDVKKGYNLHTGILPVWGGCDIIYHTLRTGAKEQGLTFHKITDKFDEGPIISKSTYPVFPGDTMLDLYKKMLEIAPYFALSSLKLLEKIEDPNNCQMVKPALYKRGEILEKDKELYKDFPDKLKKEMSRK